MADETEKKFIFTADGRKLLVSQVGGIKFAVLGVALVYTEKTLVPEEPEADFNLTLDDLSLENNVVLGLKKIYYTTVSIPDKDYGSIAPQDTNKYINALNDLEKYLIPVHYKPTLEKRDAAGNAYGTYDFDVDKTTLSWDMYNSIAFKYIVLFGKQYAETSDATFNVDKTQKPTVIGIVKYPEDSVIMFNKEASDYCAEKVQLTFTITDQDSVLDTSDEEVQEVMEASKKLSLINNGLYTRDADDPEVGVSMSIAGTQTIIEDLDLDANGALAMTKTLMVAEKTNGTELVEQLNPGSMVHIVNNEIKDEGTEKIDYKPQLVFTTIEGDVNQDLTQEITAYNTIFSLHGKGNDLSTTDASITGIESPIFELNSIPTDDYYAVNIFGHNNKILEDPISPVRNSARNMDVMLFSNSNSSMNPASENSYNRNTFIFADYNKIQDESYGNLLLGAKNTIIREGSYNNIIINRKTADRLHNVFANASYNTTIGAHDTIISADANHFAQYNTIIGGGFNAIYNSSRNILLSLGNLTTHENGDQIIMGRYNTPCTAAFIFGYGNPGESTRNLMELYPNGELKLFNSNGRNTVTLGGDAGVQVNSLAVSTFSADHGYFSKAITVGDPGGNGYPYRGLYLNYTPTTNQTFLDISQGRAGANLSYQTSTETLSIYHNYYSDPDHANYATINNEYAKFGYYIKEGYASLNTSILINGNITGPETETKEDGTLTVYRQKKYDLSLLTFKTINKVNIHSSDIQFNSYNTASNSWELVKEIGPNQNNRISMDVYVFGADANNWSTTIASIRGGTEQQKVFLYDLFANCPPFGYSSVGSNLAAPKVSYRINGGTATVGSLYSLIDDTNYMELLASNKSNLLKKNPFNNTTSTHTSNDEYYQISVLPDYIDELEINLYIRGYDLNHFYMFWIPGVSSPEIYRNNEPVIKMNIIIPKELDVRNVIYYRNFDYYSPDDYELSRFSKQDRTACEVLQLRCRPYKVYRTEGASDYHIKYENEAYACCWNKF